MRGIGGNLRTLGVLGMAVTVAVVAQATPVSAGSIDYVRPVVSQAFYADSGDPCPLGYVEGELTWIGANGSLPVGSVVLRGTVIDRPLPIESSPVCLDPRYTVVSFAAYRGKATVHTASVTADNEMLAFKFKMPDPAPIDTKYMGIDRIVVQVCRQAPADLKLYDYCGEAVEYTPMMRRASIS